MDESIREGEPVSLFEELPFHEEIPPSEPSQLTPLHTNLPQVSLHPPTETQGDADPPYSSSEDSPAQSRKYVRASLHTTLAEFHQGLAREPNRQAATFEVGRSRLGRRECFTRHSQVALETLASFPAKQKFQVLEAHGLHQQSS